MLAGFKLFIPQDRRYYQPFTDILYDYFHIKSLCLEEYLFWRSCHLCHCDERWEKNKQFNGQRHEV